jgi:hypothetical protein
MSLTAAMLGGTAVAAKVVPQQAKVASSLSSPIQKQVYRGVGDDVIRVQRTKRPGIARLTHSGNSNFIVEPVTLRGARDSYLVNEIGNYVGTVPFNVDMFRNRGVSGLEILADGAWKIVIKDLTKAPRWTEEPAIGSGDAVLRLYPAVGSRGLHTMRARHSGTSNFIVAAIVDGKVDDYVINEIGSYRGRVRLPNRTSYIAITADGRWRVAR